MAATEIPPTETRPAVLPHPTEATEVPVLLVQLQDDLARSRLREAFWISVIVHLLLIIAVALSPKWIPVRPVRVVTAAELLRDRELTFLAPPPDQQKVEKTPNTNIISDKDRIATHRAPTIDRETLQRLRDARRPGAPGPGGMPAPPSPPAAVAQAQQGAGQQQPGPQAKPATPPDQGQLAELKAPPTAAPPQAPSSIFGGGMSPGSIVQQAARAAATRGSIGGGGGQQGEFGLGLGANYGRVGNIDIVSDTMGVNFGPYLSRVLNSVRMNWYALIPEAARAPLMKRGKVSIQFAIMKDGSIAGMQLIAPSGDVSLDRAAWGGITSSSPFPPLPREFGGQYLALRFHFLYNPEKSDLE